MNKANVFGILRRTFFIVFCGVLLFINSEVSAQTTVTIGDVNSSLYSERYPFNGFYDYSWGNALYLQSEIGGASTLTKVAFYVTNTPSNYTMNSQKIYVRHTTSTGFSDATYPGTSGFTLVYDGSITYNGSGWKEVTLTTPFNYNGTDNLEFLFENRDGSYATGYPTFKYTSGYSTYRLRRDYKDASFPSSCTNCARLTAALNIQLTMGCNSTLSLSPANSTICNGSNVNITASGNNTYSWSPSTGLSATTGATVTASPTSTTTYTVTGVDADNCSQTKTITVTVNALPTITTNPTSPSFCTGGNVSVTASGASTYSWSPSTGLSATTGATVTASPANTTIYTITGTDASGCVNTQTVTVTVNAVPTVSISPSSANVCNGVGTSLTASGATTYSWSPATGLSATTGATVTATPTANTTYTVIGTSNACPDTITISVTVGTVNAGTAVASGNGDPCSNSQAILTLSGNSTATTGNGTLTSERYPFNGFYDFSWSNALYLQSELGAAGTLNKVSFYVDNAPVNYTMINQKIYVRHTSSSSYSDNNYPGTSGFTLVYDGSITYNGAGWKEVTLTTPFSYNGTDNLEFLFENRDGTYATGYPLFRYTSGYADARLRRDYKDASFPSTCTNCARLTAVLNMQFNFDRALSTFVKWQYSADDVSYADLPSGTSLPCTTNVTSSTYFRAVLSNGSCTANSASTYYVTSNNYYVNDNSTAGDVFCTTVGSSSNDGRSPSKPKASINDILATYDLGACDTIFVDKGNYTEEVVINYADGGSSSGYVTLYGAGIDQTVFTAPASSNNIQLNQPDFVRVQGFTFNSSQASKNNLLIYESRYNSITGNKFTHSAYSNIHIRGDQQSSNLEAGFNKISNNTIINSSTTGYGVYLTGTADSVEIDNNTINMTAASVNDAVFITTHTNGTGANTTYHYPSNTLVYNNTITSQNWGVSIYGYDHVIDNTRIFNNTITIALKTDASGAGMWIAGIGSASSEKTYIYNNRVNGGTSGIYYTTSSDYSKVYNNYFSGNDYGLYVSTSTADNGEIYFNSFYNTLTNLYFAFSSAANWKIKNNILYTTSSSSTNACIHNGNAVIFDACDYNLFYTPNGASIARFNSTNYSTLAAFQALDHSDETTLGDEHAISSNPQYVNAGANNLDIAGTSPATLTGLAIAGITTDIYNSSRFSTPCMGANEAAPVANAGGDSTICAGQSIQLAATGGNSYSWSPATGLSATNIANPIASPTVTTSYTVTATIGAQSSTDVVVITVNATPTVNAGNDVAVCTGSGIQIGGSPAASGGTTPYTYSWSPATGLSAANVANPTASPSATTTYSLMVTGSNGCSANDTVVVTVNPLPTANAGSDIFLCFGDSVALGGSPSANGGTSPYTYTWTPSTSLTSANAANPQAFPQILVNYILTVTDANQCQAVDTVVVNGHPPVIIQISSAEIANDTNTYLTVSGGVTYSWFLLSNPGQVIATGSHYTVSPTSDTHYLVIGTDTNNCTGTDTILVKGKPVFVTVTVQNVTETTPGSALITPTRGTAPFQYIWDGIEYPYGTALVAMLDSIILHDSLTLSPAEYQEALKVLGGALRNDLESGLYNLEVKDANNNSFTTIVKVGSTFTLFDVEGISQSGNTLTKTAANGWNNNKAVLENALAPLEDGGVEATLETGANAAFGLIAKGTSSVPLGYSDILYGFLVENNEISFLENGTNIPSGRTYSSGDNLSVLRKGTEIVYYKNSSVLRTTAVNNNTSLLMKTVLDIPVGPITLNPFFPPKTKTRPTINASITHIPCGGSTGSITVSLSSPLLESETELQPITYSWSGPNSFSANTATISNLSITGTYTVIVSYSFMGIARTTSKTFYLGSDVKWINPDNVTVTGNTIIKNSATSSLDAGAISSNRFEVNNPPALQWFEFKFEDNSTYAFLEPLLSYCGIAGYNTDTKVSEIKYGIQYEKRKVKYAIGPTIDGLKDIFIWKVVENGVTSTSLQRPNNTSLASANAAGFNATLGDVFRIELSGGLVKFYKNNIYQGYITQTINNLDFHLDASIRDTLTGIVDAHSSVPCDPIEYTSISSDTICAGTTVDITFSTNITFGENNLFTAQLSDNAGIFSNPPTIIGTLNTTTGGVISAAIPANLPGGNYFIRLVSSNPVHTGIANGFSIHVNALPTISINGDATICVGDSTNLTASGAGAYSWSPSNGLNTTSGSNVIASPSQTTIYTVTGYNASTPLNSNNFETLDNWSSSLNQATSGCALVIADSYDLLTDAPACEFALSGTDHTNPGTGKFYLASKTDGTGDLLTKNFNVSPNTQYYTSIWIMNPLNPVQGYSNDPHVVFYLNGNAISSKTLPASTGSWEKFDFTWNSNGTSNVELKIGLQSNSNAHNWVALDDFQLSQNNSCSNTQTFTVNVNPLPLVNINGDTSICSGISTTLIANGASTYSWNNGILSDSITVSPTVNSTYWVMGTDSNSCIGFDSVRVSLDSISGIDFYYGGDCSNCTPKDTFEVCVGGTLPIRVEGAGTYSWQPNLYLSQDDSSFVLVTPLSNIIYTVVGSTTGGCTDTAFVYITVIGSDSSLAVSPDDTTICAGNTVNIHLIHNNTDSIDWAPKNNVSFNGTDTFTATPLSTTTYTVSSTNSCKVKVTKTFTIHVNSNPYLTLSGQSNWLNGNNSLDKEFVWVNALQGSSTDIYFSNDIDNQGNVYAVGGFQDSTEYDPNIFLDGIKSEDAVVTKYDPNGNTLWIKEYGDTLFDFATSVITNHEGGIYVAGISYYRPPHNASGAAPAQSAPADSAASDTTGGVQASATSIDLMESIFLLKYSGTGTLLWERKIENNFTNEGAFPSITIDSLDNVHLFASFSDTLKYDTIQRYSSSVDIFHSKFNASGDVQFIKSQYLQTNQFATGICSKTDNTGNVYLTGTYRDQLSNGQYNFQSHNNSNDIFTIKTDANGNVLTINSAGSNGEDRSRSIAVDANENTYISGIFSDTLLLGGQSIVSNGMYDAFFAKISKQGNLLWIRGIGGTNRDDGNSIFVKGNKIFGYGTFRGTIQIGANTYQSNNTSGYIVEFDQSGNIIWSKEINDLGNGSITPKITADNNYNLYVSGGFTNKIVSFDNISYANKGEMNGFVGKLSNIILPVCNGTPTILHTSSNGVVTISPLTGVTEINDSTYSFNIDGSINYTIVSTTAQGCSVSEVITVIEDSINITINPNPANACYKEPITLQAFGADYYNWSPLYDVMSTSSNLSAITVSPRINDTYTVYGFSKNGCRDTVIVPFNVNFHNPFMVMPDTSIICPGSEVELAVLSDTASNILCFDGINDLGLITDGFTKAYRNLNHTTAFWFILEDSTHVSKQTIISSERKSDSTIVFEFGINSNYVYINWEGTTYQYNQKHVYEKSWYHFAAVRENDSIRVYLDGEILGRFLITTVAPTDSGNIVIGAISPHSPSQFFYGCMDDLRIFHSSLSTDLIALLASSYDTLAGVLNLSGYYDLNEGQGTFAYDLVRNMNVIRLYQNGTLQNGPSWANSITYDAPENPVSYLPYGNYNWYPSNSVMPSVGSIVQATPSASTTYTVVTSGSGCVDTAYATVIVINTPVNPGVISGNQQICNGNKPATIQFTTLPSGGIDNYNYLWQTSADGQTWTTDSSSYSPSINPPSLYQTTYYHCLVWNSGCDTAITNTVQITVLPDLLAGSITADTIVCYSQSLTTIHNLTTASGGDADQNYNYSWEYTVGGSTVWHTITGATFDSLPNPSIDTAGAHNVIIIRRWVKQACDSAVTTTIAIVFIPQPILGALSPTTQNVCAGDFTQPITGTQPIGGSGNPSYSWEYLSGVDGNWLTLTNDTESFLPAFIAQQTITVRRVVIDACGITYNDPCTINVHNGGVIASNQIICYNAVPSALSSISPPDAGNFVTTIQWESSTDSATWTPISGATGLTYSPDTLKTTTWFRRSVIILSGPCTEMYSNVIKITVSPEVTLVLDNYSYLVSSDSVLLTGGNPPGGYYSGAGVIDSLFYPDSAGAGTHTLTYHYLDTLSGCSDSATVSVDVILIEIPPGFHDEPVTGISFNNYGTFVRLERYWYLNVHGHIWNEYAYENDLQVNSGGAFLNYSRIRLTKDWTNNVPNFAFRTRDTGNVEMFGITEKIRGAYPTQFYKLKLSGYGKKSMHVDTYVNGILDLTENEMATRNNVLYVNTPETYAIQRRNGFISNDYYAGRVSRETNVNDKYIFPLGSSIIDSTTILYRPIYIEPLSASTNRFEASLIPESPDSSYNPLDPADTRPRSKKYQDIADINNKFYYYLNKTNNDGIANNIAFYTNNQIDGGFQSVAHWDNTAITPTVLLPNPPLWKNTYSVIPNTNPLYTTYASLYTTITPVVIANYDDFTNPFFSLSKAGYVVNTGGGFGNSGDEGPNGDSGTVVLVSGPCVGNDCPPNTPYNVGGGSNGAGGQVVTNTPLPGTYCITVDEGPDNTKAVICYVVDINGMIDSVHVKESGTNVYSKMERPLSGELYALINGTTLVLNSAPKPNGPLCNDTIYQISIPLEVNTTANETFSISPVDGSDPNIRLKVTDLALNQLVYDSNVNSGNGNTTTNWIGHDIGVPVKEGVYQFELTLTRKNAAGVYTTQLRTITGQFFLK